MCGEILADHSKLKAGRQSSRVERSAWTALSFVVLTASVATAQTPAGSASADGTVEGREGSVRMYTLLEKTIFKVDVLTVEIWLGEEDARLLEGIIAGGRYSSDVADAVAEVAIYSEDALVRLEFVRDASFEQFLAGVDENLRLVPSAGIIPDADYQGISENLPRWFAFLAERGIHKGDKITYRIRRDTLHTRYLAADGQVLLDQTDVGSSAPLSVLGSYFVEKSEFRKGLVSSLFASSPR
ncbi:MAG: hypothetical protein GTO46_06860 [Gemmatimonadetes bacterium]|nr:hypothetical protein [Gemmatimonadota bacterium]NIO31349.1 hypothetical protein [Gemmatimonadota bacterium]